MNSTVSTAQISDYLSRHLGDVFEMMLSMKAVSAPGTDAHRLHGERVTGTVGLAGDAVTGSVYLNISPAFALQATAAMLGLPAEEITGDTEINDVVGEVTNMLAGGLKSWLCDSGASCALTTPAVIRGNSFEINPKPGVEIILIGFECGENKGLVEAHIKFS
jgi:chemotaxis protein CheX